MHSLRMTTITYKLVFSIVGSKIISEFICCYYYVNYKINNDTIAVGGKNIILLDVDKDNYVGFKQKTINLKTSFANYVDFLSVQNELIITKVPFEILFKEEELQMMINSESNKIKLVDNIKYNLYTYQVDGVKKIVNLAKNNYNCLLADEMGLGKTLQTISAIENLGYKSVLIIVPKSLMQNWKSEFMKFSTVDEGRIVIHSGVRNGIKEALEDKIIITTYETAKNDISLLRLINWDCIIIDEAHNLKNYKSKRYKKISLIKSKFKIIITGTPWMNSNNDINTIKGLVLDYKVESEVENDILTAEFLGQKLKYITISRSLLDVSLDLPELIESYIELKSNHINYKKNKKKNMIYKDISECSHQYDKNVNEDELFSSEKFEFLMELISIVHSRKKKIIIFSDFISVQTALSKKISQVLKEETLIINGSTKDAASMVKKFSDSNDSVLIASPKVAGAGLNITSANYIIFFNMLFNEGQLNQAKKRAHRIGQKDIVFCYYLYYKDSIESEYYNKRIPHKKQIQKAAENGYKI